MSLKQQIDSESDFEHNSDHILRKYLQDSLNLSFAQSQKYIKQTSWENVYNIALESDEDACWAHKTPS